MQLLDGKLIANQIKEELKEKVHQLKSLGYRAPKLGIILVGDNPASQTYVRNKIKACQQVGIDTELIKLPEQVSQKDLLAQVQKLNRDSSIDGFIVQLPLPKHIDENLIIENIAPNKDVDGFHPINIGKTLLGLPAFNPATPKGIIEFLTRYNIQIEGKHVVIIGRSNIVGKPLAAMLIQKMPNRNATVTVCHSRTKNLEHYTKQADILVAAIGKAKFIKASMVKPGAVVIDVGINAIPDSSKKSGYRLVGDVDFEEVKEKVQWISPVPGGVGQMTVVALLQNVLQAFEWGHNLHY